MVCGSYLLQIMSKNIVFEGWLTKSPPTKRIWRTKWRRRWFALRHGEIPGQYFLDYYADRNCRRLKGNINLDLCEQVDAGLHMERTGNSLDHKLRGSVFTIQTQQRTYHLEADCKADMEKWVDAICRVCGLQSTEDSSVDLDTFQTRSPVNDQYDNEDRTGPYIPISECITGVRPQAFDFDPNNIVVSRRALERVSVGKNRQMYLSHPHIRLPQPEFSENESDASDDDCQSLNASQSNIRNWSVQKTFTKTSISPKRNGRLAPPTPPPRPPKTLQKESYYGPKFQEPVEVEVHDYSHVLRAPERSAHAAPASPGRSTTAPRRSIDDEDDYPHHHQSMQYYNIPSLPPAVDRALKPRRSSITQISHLFGQMQLSTNDYIRTDELQYLDLDLHSSNPTLTMPKEPPARWRKGTAHGSSLSECDSAYKTVDFLKTEAFNITRQDAEASRSNHQ